MNTLRTYFTTVVWLISYAVSVVYTQVKGFDNPWFVAALTALLVWFTATIFINESKKIFDYGNFFLSTLIGLSGAAVSGGVYWLIFVFLGDTAVGIFNNVVAVVALIGLIILLFIEKKGYDFNG